MNIKYLSELSDEQICDQILQILNYSSNNLGDDKLDYASLLSNISSVLPSKSVDNMFKESLNRSVTCIVKDLYDVNIPLIEANNPSSFLIAPLTAKDHAFNCLIYKTVANGSRPSYKCIVVNKGARGKHHMYEQYMIPEKYIDDFISIIGYNSQPSFSIEDIYDCLNDIDPNSQSLYNIVSSEQKENNCFFKELESCAKLAYSISTDQPLKNPKWPVSTLQMHRDLLNNIKAQRPSLSAFIDDIENIYTKNKKFRKECEKNPDIKSIEKMEILKKVFDPNNTVDIEECIKQLDLENFSNNNTGLRKLCAADKNLNNKYGDIISTLYSFINDSDDTDKFIEFYQKNNDTFPYVFKQLGISYSQKYFDKGVNFINSKDYTNASLYFDKVLAINPNNAQSYYFKGLSTAMQGDFENSKQYFNKAFNLSPKNTSLREVYANLLFDHNHLKEAKEECKKILDIEPFNSNIRKLNTKINDELGIDIF